MKRSEIDQHIDRAVAFLNEHHFLLPPFAYWTTEDWKTKGPEYNEIRDNMLGWDLTDFGSNDFEKCGLLLFTLRNGNPHMEQYKKTYAEKVLVVQEDQITPYHFHWYKMEDIINRGGGNMLVQLYNSNQDESVNKESDVFVTVDGCRQRHKAGSILRIHNGESITLTQGLYHSFWAEKGHGPALLGEVSQTNDDNADNRFAEPRGRFPAIDEDAPKRYLLCNDPR